LGTAINEKATVNQMQLLKIFEHLMLTNSHLFLQKLMPVLYNNDVTVT